MEMGNVSKRQQPDQIKNNSRGSPTGLCLPETCNNIDVKKYIYIKIST